MLGPVFRGGHPRTQRWGHPPAAPELVSGRNRIQTWFLPVSPDRTPREPATASRSSPEAGGSRPPVIRVLPRPPSPSCSFSRPLCWVIDCHKDKITAPVSPSPSLQGTPRQKEVGTTKEQGTAPEGTPEQDGERAGLEHSLDADPGPRLGPTEPVTWAVNIPGRTQRP